MTPDEFQKQYHEFKTPDRDVAVAHAAVASAKLTEDAAVVVNFGGEYGLMLKSAARFLADIGLVEREPTP